MTSRQEAVARIVYEEIFKSAKELGWAEMIGLKGIWASGAPWGMVSENLRSRFLTLGMAIVQRISHLPRQ